MHTDLSKLLDKIKALETEIEHLMSERREAIGYRLHQGRLVIEREVLARQKKLKIGAHRYLVESGFLTVLTAPLIYIVSLPLLGLDALASLYQSVCFRVYGIKQVKRRKYVVFDRHRLPYLNLIQKINCIYCSYATGVLAYVSEITSRTEQYWCPIKHARRVEGSHARYQHFLEYGDVENYPESLGEKRKQIRNEDGE